MRVSVTTVMFFVIVFFGTVYFFSMKDNINNYLFEGKVVSFNWYGNLINCIYFSIFIFLNLKLPTKILKFPKKRKLIILFEWLLGYVAIVILILLSKSTLFLNIKDFIFKV